MIIYKNYWFFSKIHDSRKIDKNRVFWLVLRSINIIFFKFTELDPYDNFSMSLLNFIDM